VRQANESTSIEFTAEIQDIDGTLSPEQEISLFRIVQESFNNIIKHSGATNVTVNVLRNADAITVTISDNGKGIPQTGDKTPFPVPGFGISGMQERAKMFGWEFSIQSTFSGTTISMIIAYKQ
jgi:signal transduction histidine kinase